MSGPVIPPDTSTDPAEPPTDVRTVAEKLGRPVTATKRKAR